MAMTFNDLPLFEATMNNADDGICVISLVSDPATESGWMAFKKEDINKKSMSFSIENEQEHILMGCLMRCDYPIYRYDWGYGEYYIKYGKETIALMAEKMLKDGTFNNVDIEHNGGILPKTDISLVECFIKDSTKGINPAGFEDISDGSLFIKMKCHNEELWNLCKSGDEQWLTGFSLYGYFGLEQTAMEKINKIENKKENKMKNLKELLKEVFVQFGKVGEDIYFDGDTLEVGVEVFDKDGNAYPDGEYIIDEMKYTIKDGKCEEIEKAEAKVEEPKTEEPIENGCQKKMEEEPAPEEPKTEEPKPAEPNNDEIEKVKAEFEAKIAELKNIIDALDARIAEIEGKPAVEPIAEQFTKAIENKSGKLASMLEKFGQN